MPKHDININLKNKTTTGGPRKAGKDQVIDLKPITNAISKAIKESLKPVVAQLKELNTTTKKVSPQSKETTTAKTISSELNKVITKSFNKLSKDIASAATKPTTTKTQTKSNNTAITKALKSLENTLNNSIGKMAAAKGLKIDTSTMSKSVAEAVRNALPKNTGKLITEVTNLSKELDDLSKGVTNLSKNLSSPKKDINTDKLLSELKNIAGVLKKLPTSVSTATGTVKSMAGDGKAAAAITKAFNEGVAKLTRAAKEKATIAVEVNKDKLTKTVTEALMKAQREFFGADFVDEARIEREIKKGVDKAAAYTEKKISDAVSAGAAKVKVKDSSSKHVVHFRGKGSVEKDLSAKIADYEKELKSLSDINVTVNTKGVTETINKLEKRLQELKSITDKKAFLEFDTNIEEIRKTVEDSTTQTIRFLEKRLSSLQQQQEVAFSTKKIKTDPGIAKGFNTTTEALKETIETYKVYIDLMTRHEKRFGLQPKPLPQVRPDVPVPLVNTDVKKLSQGIQKDLESLTAASNAIITITKDNIKKLSLPDAPSKNFDKLESALDEFVLALQEIDLSKLRKTAVIGFGGDVSKKEKMYKGELQILRKSIDNLEAIYTDQEGVRKAVSELAGGLDEWARDIGLMAGLSMKDLAARKKSIQATEQITSHEKRIETISKQRADLAEQQLKQERAIRTKERGTETTRPLPTPEVRSYMETLRTKTPIYKREKAISIPPLMGEEITTIEKDISLRGTRRLESQIRNEIDRNATELGKSLNTLQDYITDKFEQEFKTSAKGWEVLKEAPTAPAFTLAPGERQRTMQIANVKRIRQELQKRRKEVPTTATSKELVELLVEALTEEKIKETPREALLQDIATWLKSITSDTLKSWEGLDDALKESLQNIKSKAGEGLAVDETTVKALDDAITSRINTNLEQVYKETFGKIASTKRLQSFTVRDKEGKEGVESLVRSVALPAAKLSETGAAILETVHGSQRSLAKFATYKSGFEVLYEDLLKKQSPTTGKFKEKLQAFGGVTPTRTSGQSALVLKELSESLLRELSKGDVGYLKGRYAGAAAPTRAATLGTAATPQAIQEFEQKVNVALQGLDNVDDIIKTMADKFNMTAFDVVKALDAVKFENIYDIYKKILEAPGSPLEDLVKSPQFNSAVRNYEKAIRQVEQFMPILEPGRPRRARYQEGVVNIAAKTSELFKGTITEPDPGEQKALIKDLNVRIKELTDVNKTLVQAGKEGLPTGVLSSLGLTEAQAGSRLQFETGKVPEGMGKEFAEGVNYLKALPGVGLKMFAEDLRSLAPFGEQFQQVGRNISNVSNAMTSSLKSIEKMPGEPIKGVEAEFPKLRTAKEEQLIKSGVYGGQGYGFNVLAEMRQTAGTFEDQVLISGKLADALTEAVKNLIKPSAAGILGDRGPSMLGPGVSKIEKGLVKDINKVAQAYQKIFGAPQVYEGGADKALIEEVKKTIAVVRGQDVELQAAKLAEVFVSHFGRKITTRFGSKGVGITAAKGAAKTDILSILETFGAEKGMVKVLGKEEREKAGLGTAIMPKSMGQLMSELIERELKHFDISDTKALKTLRTELVQSGNKFILDIFKEAGEGLVTAEEAQRQKRIFTEASKAFKDLYGIDLISDIKGIKQLQDKYMDTLGALASLFEEKPIDIRISAHGIAKRGLQTEVLESVTANVAGAGRGGRTVLQQQLPKESYEKLLGRGKAPGTLSQAAGALGYTRAYDVDFAAFERDLIERFTAGIDKAAKPEKYQEQEDLAKRAAQLEKLSSFYVDIIDEFGKKRKSLVGEKFVQVIEEPGKFAEWSPKEIEEGIKGLKLNLPAFAAYSAIFGEGSSFMKDLQESSYLEDKKQWEYINALRVSLGKSQEVANQIIETLPTIKATDIKTFAERTGRFDVDAPAEKQLRGTIVDIDKFSTAFKLLLPTAKKGVTEPFYVPGPLARESYEDPLIAGEYALSDLARRLQTLVDSAHEVITAQEAPPPVEDIIPIVAGKILEASRGKGKQYLEDLKGLLSAAEGSLGKAYYTGVGAEKDIGSYAARMKKDVSQLSQLDFISFIEEKSQGNYKRILGSLMDLIVGPQEAPKGSEFEPRITARRQMETVLEKAYNESDQSLNEMLKFLGIENAGEKAMQKKLGRLNKAKEAYYNELKKLVLGKSGAIGKTIFTKRIPSIMAKAVSAVVDKTEEMDAFKEQMASLAMEFGDLTNIIDPGTLGDIATAMEEVSNIHSESISKYKKELKVPVLKQHELAIPPEMAKSLKVSFTKRYNTMGAILGEAERIDGTLFDLLTYVEELEKNISGRMGKIIDVQAQQDPTTVVSTDVLKKYIDEELAPYIESVRFPFTGISSVQPYRAKLGKAGPEAKRTLAVPGVPEMPAETFKLFKEQIEKVQGIRTAAMTAREAAWEEDDVDKVQRLTSLIDKLNEAISNIIPKYIAHQQKLDFDGDSIQVHTAQNIKSRQEIKKHYDTLMKDVDSTAAMFRDLFTSEAIQAPTEEFTLASMMKSFEKKFPAEKGFEFLKKPFLTEELEYLSKEEQLKILGQTAKQTGAKTPIATALGKVGMTTLTRKEDIAQLENVLSKVVAGSTEDLAETAKMAVQHIDSLDESLKDVIFSSIKATLFQEKYRDAIEAQLFKIHTGPETEALTRLQRVLETRIGTGGGVISPVKPFDVTRERTIQMNEFLRFALQKGMDVKHAGGQTVGGEIVNAISGSREDLSEFIDKIKSEDQPDYSEMRDFIKANTAAIENFLGKKPTEEIRTLVSKLSERKDIETLGRAELKKEYISKMGIEGLLKDLQEQVYSEAAKGLVALGKSPSIDAAMKKIEQRAEEGFLSINETITKVFDKLYSYRTFTGAAELKKQEPVEVAKQLEEDLSKALSASNERLGAYSEMVRSSIMQAKNQNAELLKVAKELQSYDPKDEGVAAILNKILSGEAQVQFDIGQAWVGEDISKIEEIVAYYTKLAGIPPIPKYKKAELREEAETLVRPLAVEAIDKGAMSDERYAREIDKFANSYINKIESLYQIDKAINVIQQKAKIYEPISFRATKTTPKVAITSRTIAAGKRDVFAPRTEEAILPPPPGRTPPEVPAVGFGAPEGKPVPVYLVGIAPDVGIPGLKQAVSMASLGTRKTPLHEDPQFINELRDIASEISGGINELKGSTFRNIFRASGISAGGEFRGQAGYTGQVKAIQSIMKGGKAGSKLLDATALIGVGLHEQIEEAMRKQYGAGNIIAEQLVYLDDEIAGLITGHIDAIIKGMEGEPSTVVDIKTITTKTERKLKGLIEKVGTSDFTVLQEELAKSSAQADKDLLKKLEDTASQVNFYMKAMEERGEKVKAEAHLYDRFGKLVDPAKVKFTFDPKRFEEDMKAIAEARIKVLESGEAFAETASLDELMAAAKKTESTKVSKDKIKKLVEGAKKYYKAMAAAGEFSTEAVPRSERFGISNAQMKLATEEARRRAGVGRGPQAAADIRTGGPKDTLINLKRLHQRAKIAQRDIGIDEAAFAQLPEEVKRATRVASEIGPQYEKFIALLDMLKMEGGIEEAGIFKAWRFYKMSIGDFFLEQARIAEENLKQAEATGLEGNIEEARSVFERSLSRMQTAIKKGLGKKSDIYTRDKRYFDPELASAAGVFMTPEEIQKKAAGPLGPDPKLFKLYADMVRDLKPTAEGITPDLTPAIDKARQAVAVLSDVDMEIVKLMEDADLMKRIGPEIADAWDFTALVRDISKLREALEYFARYNVAEESLAPQRKNIENLIKYLKNAEALYTPFATKRRERTGTEADYGITGAIKVPKWLEPGQQVGMHKKNVEAFREYFTRSVEKGGPKIGRHMTYVEKVFDEAGNVIKNVAHDFNKYGEATNKAGQQISLFNEKQRDLVAIMQGSQRTFGAAIGRAIRWGAASTVVYGGFSKLKQAVGTMADIETSLAQLRMVMNEVTTDFDMLSGAAIDFAKQYGVGVNDVLKAMKIFAQQGLSQAEVIERTRTATLAANVTTLTAKDATEALTAAMKVFGQETDSSMKYLDAWSEVEARHAITAGDMADAIKKSAAAAKNAGFTFDELNGIVAAVGAVTRQTGKEVGTSMRFIMRRLASEKGPTELAKLGIPVMTEEGELRKGFDILSDLNKAWRDLTSAQKMSTSQAIGGTRQYNALLVMMDNWDEALQAVRDSMNSKGSAERRNLELMKTYEKQLEQTRAAATELQMSFGKIVLPAFKTALQGMRTFLETINNIPGPIKAAGAFAVALITYLSKGADIVQNITNMFRAGGSKYGDLLNEVRQELSTTRYEIFGESLDKFLGPQLKRDIAGLKTLSKQAVTEGVDFTVSPEGITKVGPLLDKSGKSIDDFSSGLGKAVFVLNEWGMQFNEVIGDIATGTAQGAGTAGDALEKLSKKIGIVGNIGLQGLAALTQGNIIDDLAVALVNAADVGVGALSKLFKTIEGTLGPTAAKWVENFASENTNLVKAVGPLATFLFGVYKASDKLYTGYVRTTKSAQDYAKSQYGIKRAYEDQLQSIRTLSGDYGTLQTKLEDIQKASRPDVKARRQELGTYESPLLSMGKLYKNAVSVTNQLAETNIGLVAGYDNLGNAILKSTNSLQGFIDTAERSRIKDIAKADIDVAAKFIEDLTQIEGPEKWKEELRTLLKEVPVFGEMLAKGIKVGPAKALDTLSKQLNKLLAARAEAPLSTVFDKDIKKYQESLKTVRTEFNTTYSDFRKLISDISTTGLSREEISTLLSAPELQKGYQLIVEVDPVLNTQALKGQIEWQDVLGAEVMRRVYPQLSSALDITGALTKARLESAGAIAREGKVIENDLVMFMDSVADKYNIAGNQAIVSIKETTDGVYEWVATYFNTKTLQIEERPFDTEMQKFVNNVFPQKAIEKDISDRIEALNEFVAGAGAGLRGISAKDFRKDFSLGERFFSDIETTTLLQGGKGFVPSGRGGTFGTSPFQENWAETFKEFYVKPMQDYRMKLEQLEKLRLEGLEENVTLATGMYEELVKLQEVLKNNQVVFQYRAVLVDLTKTLEASTRTMQENIAIEKSRQEMIKSTSGYMKGVAEGLDALDLGVQKYSDLNVKQRSLISSPDYRTLAKELKTLTIQREGAAENVFASDRALVALESIGAVSKGFGAALSPEQLKNYTETVARTGSTGFAEMTIETSKVVENTSATVERLDQILENLSNTEDLTSMLDKYGKETSPRSMVDAMEKVARIREKAAGTDNDELVIASNKALDILSKNLVEQEGVKRAIELVDSNFTLLGKRFRPEEMAQRAFGNLDQAALISNLRDVLPPEKKWFGLKTVEGQPTFERDIAKLIELQKQNNQEQMLSSKAAIKSATALAIFETLQKSHTNKTIQKLDEQIKTLETKLGTAGLSETAQAKTTEELTALKEMRGTEETKAKFHAVVQQMSAITAGSMQFAKAIGLSEDGIKNIGIGAVGLYGSMKLASQILGTDLPTAAKNFGKELENIAKAFAAGERPGFYQFYKTKKAGEEFVKKSKAEGFGTGGLVVGPGGPTDDKIMAGLSNGEFVIKASAAGKLGKDKLDYMNETGMLPMMAAGGAMGIISPVPPTKPGALPPVLQDILDKYYKKPEILDLLLKNIPEEYRDYLKNIIENPPVKGGPKTLPIPGLPDILKDKDKYRKYATGGGVDDILAMVSNGEYIINTKSARKIGYDKLGYINKHGKLPKFADGGVVGEIVAEKQAAEAYARVTATLDNDSINRMTQALAVALGTTMAGYVTEKNAESTRLASLNKKAKKESEAIADLIVRNKEAAQVVYDQMTAKIGPKPAAVRVETEEKSLVLDTEKERKKVEASLKKMREGAVKEYERLASEASELQDHLARLEVKEQITMELEAVEKAVRDFKISDEIVRELEKSLYEYDITFSKTLENVILGPLADIVSKTKKYESMGLLAGKYRPQSVEFGPRTIADLTPEESLSYRGRLLEPNKIEKIILDALSIPVDMVSFVKKDFGKIFKGLEEAQKERDIRLQKLQEMASRKAELNVLRKTKSLSAAEKEELSRLKDVTSEMTDELKDLTDEIEKTKDKLRKPLLEEQEFIKEAQRQLEIATDKGNKALIASLKTGRGIFEGRPSPTTQPYDPDIRRLEQLTPYQFSERLSRLRGEEEPFKKYDKTAEESLIKAIQETNAELIKAQTAAEPDTVAIEVYNTQLKKQKKALKEVVKENTKYIEAIERRISVDAGLADTMDEVYARLNRLRKFDVDRFMSNVAYGQPALAGFGGEGAIAPELRELTGQQALFAKGSKTVKDFINNFKFAQTEIDNYGSRVTRLEEERVMALQELAAADPNTEAWETARVKVVNLTARISDLEDASAKLGITLSPATDALRVLTDFANMAAKFANSIDNIKVQQAVTSTKEYISYQDKLNKMYGSSSKFAAQYISVFDQFQAAVYGGKILRPFESDQFDLQEADLRKRLFSGNLRGTELWETGLQLSMLPAERERATQAEELTKARQALTTQMAPYQELVSELERTMMRPGVSPEQQADIRELQRYIQQAIEAAVSVSPERMIKEGEQLKAFGPEVVKEIQSRLAELQIPEETMATSLETALGTTNIKLDTIDESINALKALFQEQGLTADQIKEVAPGLMPKAFIKEGPIGDFITKIYEVGVGFAKMMPFMQGATEGLEILDKGLQVVTSALWNFVKDVGETASQRMSEAFGKAVDYSPIGVFRKEAKAAGGFVSGPGGPTEDKIPALLSNGEYVIKASSAKTIGYNTLDFINKNGKTPMMAEGGPISKVLKVLLGGSEEFSAPRAKKDLESREKQLEKEFKKQIGHAEGGPIDKLIDFFFRSGSTELSAVKAKDLLKGRGESLEKQLQKQIGHAEGGPIDKLINFFFRSGSTELSAVKAKDLLKGRGKSLEEQLQKQLGHAEGGPIDKLIDFFFRSGSTELSAPAAKKKLEGRGESLEEEFKKQIGHAEGGPISNIFDFFFRSGSTELSAPAAKKKLESREKQLEEQLQKQLGHAEGGLISKLFNVLFGGSTEFSAVRAKKDLSGREKRLQEELQKQLGHANGGQIKDPEQLIKEIRDNTRMGYSMAAQRMINQQPGLPQGLITTPITSDLSRYDFDIPETASVRSSATRQGPLSRMTALGVEAAKSGKLPTGIIEAYAKNLEYIREGRKAGYKVTSRGPIGQAMSIAMDANRQAAEVFRAQIADPKKLDAYYKDLEKRGVLGGFKRMYGAEGLKYVQGQAPGTTTFQGMMGMALGDKEWLNLFSKSKDIGTGKMPISTATIETLIKQLLEGTDAYKHKIKLAQGGLVSIPTMHTGGSVKKDGLHNLQKGEFVISKALAEGGLVEKTLGVTTSNGAIEINVDDFKEQIDRFEKILEDMDLTLKNTEPLENLADDIVLKAELEDNKVYLDKDTVTLDTSSLTGLTGAVGADELADKLDTAISSLDDRVSRIREEAEADLEILNTEQEETANRLYSKFDESLKLEKAVLERKLNELSSDSEDNYSKATQLATSLELQINDVKRELNLINTQLYSKS